MDRRGRAHRHRLTDRVVVIGYRSPIGQDHHAVFLTLVEHLQREQHPLPGGHTLLLLNGHVHASPPSTDSQLSFVPVNHKRWFTIGRYPGAVTTDAARRLRADAVRNSERIQRAARTVWAEQGPDAPLEEIARRAGVGIATLYRRFPDKAVLARAALDQSIAENLAPVIETALADDNPLHGLATLIEAALDLAACDLNTLAAARSAGSLTPEVDRPFYEALTQLARRAQETGLLRTDLVPEDLPRIMAMLTATLWTMDQGSGGWRRYLALILDSLAPAAAHPLPPVVSLPKGTRPGDWLL